MAGVFVVFFFFKQKTAYEVEYGLVGSEMCIRDRDTAGDWTERQSVLPLLEGNVGGKS
mgnify:CR=1 FL=1